LIPRGADFQAVDHLMYDRDVPTNKKPHLPARDRSKRSGGGKRWHHVIGPVHARGQIRSSPPKTTRIL